MDGQRERPQRKAICCSAPERTERRMENSEVTELGKSSLFLLLCIYLFYLSLHLLHRSFDAFAILSTCTVILPVLSADCRYLHHKYALYHLNLNLIVYAMSLVFITCVYKLCCCFLMLINSSITFASALIII